MKVVIINKSDSTGGAAVVSFRLMTALRNAGIDARMVVSEKLSDSPYVSLAATPARIKWSFILERLKIFIANGLNRSTLFKIDTASDGIDLSRNPVVKEADVVCLNWINQGLLSLKGIRRLLSAGKKVIWTMHDMWCMTGICHHAGECNGFADGECNRCPLLKKSFVPSLAHKVWKNKYKLYNYANNIQFVAVSNWLKERSKISELLGNQTVTVIPNAFPFENEYFKRENDKDKEDESRKIRLLFGAARLDDPIKGLPTLIETTRILAEDYPDFASRIELVTFGTAKDPDAFSRCAIPIEAHGRISGKEAVRKIYESCDIVISTSHYETLPGTLVEAQAYGCVPVAFDRGGQKDIIHDRDTGVLVSWDAQLPVRARAMADAVVKAADMIDTPEKKSTIRRKMFESAYSRFNEPVIAKRYIELFSMP